MRKKHKRLCIWFAPFVLLIDWRFIKLTDLLKPHSLTNRCDNRFTLHTLGRAREDKSRDSAEQRWTGSCCDAFLHTSLERLLNVDLERYCLFILFFLGGGCWFCWCQNWRIFMQILHERIILHDTICCWVRALLLRWKQNRFAPEMIRKYVLGIYLAAGNTAVLLWEMNQCFLTKFQFERIIQHALTLLYKYCIKYGRGRAST